MALANFTSSTGGGRFDVDLQGSKMKITVKLGMVNMTHRPVEQDDFDTFINRFETAVKNSWEGKYGFKRGNTTYKPKFTLAFHDENNQATAHYVINLCNGSGVSANVSRNVHPNFQNLKDQGQYAPLKSQLYNESDRVETGLTQGTAQAQNSMFPLYIDTYNGQLSPFTLSHTKLLMTQVAKARANLKIHVTSYGLAKNQAQTDVVNMLRGCGLNNVKTRKSKKCFIPKLWGTVSTSRSSQRPDYVKISVAGAVDQSAFQNNTFFQYPSTCAHEFGHMLGLIDEYTCISDQAKNRLVQLNFLEQTEVNRFEELARGAGEGTDDVKAGMEEFYKLCQQAGVEPTFFGRYTFSIMSAGSQFLPCHFVTLWEALKQETGHNDWQIVPLT